MGRWLTKWILRSGRFYTRNRNSGFIACLWYWKPSEWVSSARKYTCVRSEKKRCPTFSEKLSVGRSWPGNKLRRSSWKPGSRVPWKSRQVHVSSRRSSQFADATQLLLLHYLIIFFSFQQQWSVPEMIIFVHVCLHILVCRLLEDRTVPSWARTMSSTYEALTYLLMD